MANCTKSNCKKPQAKDGGGLCADHLRLKKAADLQLAQQKAAHDKEIKDGEEKRKKLAEQVVKDRKTLEEKNKKIAEIALAWKAQIKHVVDEVIHLRSLSKTPDAVNAGQNGTLGTTLGGTNNPVQLVVPSNTYKIAKSEVAPLLHLDNSLSGFYKHRQSHGGKDILVHCQ